LIEVSNPKAQFLSHRKDIECAISRVLNSGWFILGKEVEEFEKEFALYNEVEHAIGVGSGKEALHIALRALDIGVGDEVITTSHTAVATASAIVMSGASPVFVDIDPRQFTLDPNAIEKSITKKTKAVIAVHIYGHPCDMNPILEITKQYGIKIIEDCAQAHGSRYNDKRVGSIGDIGCFSFYPTKNLGAIGDGGALVTSNEEIAVKVRLLREYGWKKRYISSEEGWNSRLDELQAAILRVKLKHLDTDNGHRQNHAKKYREMLELLPLDLPKSQSNASHVYHLYVIQTDKRDALRKYLTKHGVQTSIHYPIPIHQQSYYREIVGDVSLPITEKIASRILSLPIYPELGADELTNVIDAIKQFNHSL